MSFHSEAEISQKIVNSMTQCEQEELVNKYSEPYLLLQRIPKWLNILFIDPGYRFNYKPFGRWISLRAYRGNAFSESNM